jgi:hypothetical protein
VEGFDGVDGFDASRVSRENDPADGDRSATVQEATGSGTGHLVTDVATAELSSTPPRGNP